MAITPNEVDQKRFDKLLNEEIGKSQVLPNGKRISIITISSYLNNMDIRKVRILVSDAISNGILKYEYPLKVNSKNADISILLKNHQPEKKRNVLPYRRSINKL